MALTSSNRGTQQDKASDTSFDLSPTSNCTAGAIVLLAVAYDNAGTNGADPYSSISDGHGNTWTPRLNVLNDPGAANEGLVVRLFESNQDAATLTTASTITVTFSTNVGAACGTLTELTGTTGTPTHVTGATATGSSGSPSITTGSITSGNCVIGVTGAETNGAFTGDSDSTNGSWSAQQARNTAGGLASTNQSITSQTKVVTATATQTYNTSVASADWAILWAEYTEVAATTSLAPRSLTIPPAIVCM